MEFWVAESFSVNDDFYFLQHLVRDAADFMI
jgi:hypothetical protein